MKVTICSYDGKGYFGGPYEWIKRFGPAMRQQGIDVSFLFLSDHRAQDSTIYQYLKNQGFICRLLQVHSFTQYHDNTEDRVRWFLEQVEDLQPDFFIANSVLPALYAGKWIQEAGIPVIGISHTDDRHYQWLAEEFIQKDNGFSLTGMVCVSAWVREKYSYCNPLHIPLEAISCGTPVIASNDDKSSTPLKIVYAGKLTEEAKQITLLTEAFCRVVNGISEVEAYIYGDGPSRMEVMNTIAREDKAQRVHYKGLVSSTDIQKEIADKDVIVLLSDYEGLPVILLEAMACGLVPVCLSIESGIPELVQYNITGLLVKDRGDDFFQAIKRLKEEEGLLDRLSSNARAFVLQEHTMDVVVQKWVLFLKQLQGSMVVSKRKITIPRRIVLPPVHGMAQNIDKRKPVFNQYLMRQGLRLLSLLSKRFEF